MYCTLCKDMCQCAYRVVGWCGVVWIGVCMRMGVEGDVEVAVSV